MILYGRGLIAEEYCRYLEGCGRGEDIAAFAVTKMAGQGETCCGRPCLEIGEALVRFPQAEVHLSLQEKYHAEVIALLQEMGREPKEKIGLRRMTDLLGEQAMKQISAACPKLIVRRCPYDYSVLEIAASEHPEEKFTFYPMCQVPLSEADLAHIREYVEVPKLYIAMATSAKDASITQADLPKFVHSVLGGAASYEGTRSGDMAYDDEEAENISSYNNLYSELTVAYWLYKKAPRAEYLGLCHYRRHFLLTEEDKAILSERQADVFLPRPRLTFPNVRIFFTEHPVGHMERLDYETMMLLLGQRNEEIKVFAEKLFSGQAQFPNNMVIARRDIYLDYCRFMFDILLSMQTYYEERQIVRPQRYLGNVGEMLTTLYFAWHKDKWRTRYIDYQLVE